MAEKGFIIIEGAKAFCSSSVANNSKGKAVPLQVKSQKKKLGKNKYFAQDKPIATYLDDKADSFGGGNGFGSCKGADGKPHSCKAKCNIKYKDYYENVDFHKSMKVLLDVSTGTCPGYGVPGTIAFATTGQVNNISQIDVKEADEFSVANISPQWKTSSSNSKNATASVSSISMLSPIVANKITQSFYYVSIPKQNSFWGAGFMPSLPPSNLTLKAEYKGDVSKIVWTLFKGENTKDKIKTFINLGDTFDQPLDKLFENLKEGKYTIEAYGKKAGDKKCSIVVEVVTDFVRKINSVGTSSLINTPIPISVEYKVSNLRDASKVLNYSSFITSIQTISLYWRVKQGETILHNSYSGVISPHLVKLTSSGIAAIIEFKNTGKYTVEAFTDPNEAKPESVGLKIENKLGIMNVNGGPGLLRYDDILDVQVSKYNVEYLPTTSKKVYWYLNKKGTGRVRAFENSPLSKSLKINKNVILFLIQDAGVWDYFGEYTLEAYASPLAENKQPQFSGSDCYNFNVIKNSIAEFNFPIETVPVGTKVKYNAKARISPLKGNERFLIRHPENVSANGTEQTITFNALGEHTIFAELIGDHTDSKRLETTIKVANPLLKRALWAYQTGVKRTESGYDEESYGFIEIEGLQNVPIKVKIWIKGEGDDFYNDPEKYLLEEKSLNLNSEGKTTFKIVTNKDYKEKIKNAIEGTVENPEPPCPLIFTLELLPSTSTNIVFPSQVDITHANRVEAGESIFYTVLDDNESLNVTSEMKIVSIMFSNEDFTDVQREQAFYGKTHKIWVHTVNMAEETLKVNLLKEVPKEELSETNNIVYTHKSMDSEKEEKVGADGLLEVPITLKPEWKDETKNVEFYVAQVSRLILDPDDDTRHIWKPEKIQFTLNDSLPVHLVRTEDMEKLGIKAKKEDGTPFTPDEMVELRKQFIFYQSGCLKVSTKETPDRIENDIMPVKVEIAEVKNESGDCPRCKANITLSELQQVFKDGSKSLMEKCLPYINEYFEKFKINTCKLKAHFFSQVKVETDMVTLTESLKYRYETLFSSDISYYKGNEERCRQDAMNERAIGINAYGFKNGNRVGTEDGFNYRGRGLIMVTGRGNYEKFQKFYNKHRETLGLPNEKFVTLDNNFSGEQPEKLAEPKYAVLSGVNFWVENGLNEIVNNGTDEVKIVNDLVDEINFHTDSRDKRRGAYQGGKYTFKNKEYTYDIGTKTIFKVDECGKDNTITALNLENSDLKIKEGIEWLKSKSISQSDVLNGVSYKVPYSNDQNRILASGEDTMDCSELVCRFLAKIEWCSKGWSAGTAVLHEYAEGDSSYLIKHDDLNYKPKAGDIFIWKNLSGGMGHTGVIIDYDEETDVVKTIESISSSETPEGLRKNIRMRGVTELKWKRLSKHLLSHPTKKGNTKYTSCRFYTPIIHYSKVDKKMSWTNNGTQYKIEIIKN